MKKLNKLTKTLTLSTIAALAFGGIAVNTTYALFTNSTSSSVVVTTGKVKVSSTASITGGSHLVEGKTADITANSTTGVTFNCGGTATIGSSDGSTTTITLNKLVAGDFVNVDFKAFNESNVKIKYRVVVEADNDIKDYISLSGQDKSSTPIKMKNSANGIFSNYLTAEANSNDTQTAMNTFELKIGIDGDKEITDGKSRSGKITIKLEAVQGNASPKEMEELCTVNDVKGLTAAIEELNSGNINEGSTIEVTSNVTLDQPLSVSKDANIVLVNNSTVTPSEGQSAFVATDGAKLTIGTKTTTPATSGAIRLNRTVADTAPVIQVSGKNVPAVKADGEGTVVTINGVKIISEGGCAITSTNGAKVIVDDADVTAQEACLLAHSAGTIIVNGGTFTSLDNFVVGTNGTKGWGGNTIEINGGTFNGNITSSGYIACGVYVANSDTVTINKGIFNIKDGCGVVARSGNTTVSDDVVFSFTNTTGGITEGGVGDKSCKIPVNAKVVQDLSQPEYPGGKPVVSATGTLPISQTNGKTTIVTTEAQLKAAVADTTSSAVFIYVANDIEILENLSIVNKYTYIYGNGTTINRKENKTEIKEGNVIKGYVVSNHRIFNVYSDDSDGSLVGGSLTISGVNLIQKTSNDVNGSDTNRAINLYSVKDYTLYIDNCVIESEHYAISVSDNYYNEKPDTDCVKRRTENLTINVKNSTLTGYEDLNMYNADGVKGTFENCVLNGINRKIYGYDADNNCENIKFVNASNGQALNCDFNFTECTFNMSSENGNFQGIACVKLDSQKITMTDCKFNFKGENDTAYKAVEPDNYVDLSAGTSITINGVTYTAENSTTDSGSSGETSTTTNGD